LKFFLFLKKEGKGYAVSLPGGRKKKNRRKKRKCNNTFIYDISHTRQREESFATAGEESESLGELHKEGRKRGYCERRRANSFFLSSRKGERRYQMTLSRQGEEERGGG